MNASGRARDMTHRGGTGPLITGPVVGDEDRLAAARLWSEFQVKHKQYDARIVHLVVVGCSSSFMDGTVTAVSQLVSRVLGLEPGLLELPACLRFPACPSPFLRGWSRSAGRQPLLTSRRGAPSRISGGFLRRFATSFLRRSLGACFRLLCALGLLGELCHGLLSALSLL